MKFKNKETRDEFELSHPSGCAALLLLDDWLHVRGFPELVITDVADDGDIGRLPSSWHRRTKLCAWDLRTHHYSPEQLDQIVEYLKVRYQMPMWELITRDHGTAPHIHIARRDMNYSPPKTRGKDGMEAATD